MPIHVLDKYYLGLTAIITVGYQLAFFAVAFYLHFDKLTGGFSRRPCSFITAC